MLSLRWGVGGERTGDLSASAPARSERFFKRDTFRGMATEADSLRVPITLFLCK